MPKDYIDARRKKFSRPPAGKAAIIPADFCAGDFGAAARLAITATIGLTDLVETMHHNILRVPGILGTPSHAPTNGITGLVYRNIRRTTRLVGGALNAAIGQLMPLIGPQSPSKTREAIVAALNGVIGDHLAVTNNPLAISMQFRRDGKALELTPEALNLSLPRPTGRILLFVHGLCMNDLQWQRGGHDHGARLATVNVAAFSAAKPTPIYLQYNSGLHISTNGQALAAKLEALVAAWPVAVEQIDIIGHSMGGLVARSACFYAKDRNFHWPSVLRKMIFLGSPHTGAPLERGGNYLNVVLDASPYTAAFARLAKMRSPGITDLRHGSLLDDDWTGKDRFATGAKSKTCSVHLPEGVKCYAIAATRAAKTDRNLARSATLPGDGLVPVASALGRSTVPGRHLGIPEAHQWITHGINHLELLSSTEVYEQISNWLFDR